MKNFTFVAESLFKMFEPLEEMRKTGKSKEYRTLVDSVAELVKSFYVSERHRRDEVILWIFRTNVKQEIKELEKSASSALANLFVKKHHDYLISYNKLRNVEQDICTVISRPPYLFDGYRFPIVPGKLLKVRVYSKYHQQGIDKLEQHLKWHEGEWKENSRTPEYIGHAIKFEFYADSEIPHRNSPPLFPEENIDYMFLDKKLNPSIILNSIIPLFPNVSHTYLL